MIKVTAIAIEFRLATFIQQILTVKNKFTDQDNTNSNNN